MPNKLLFKRGDIDFNGFISDNEIAALLGYAQEDKNSMSRLEIYLSKSGLWNQKTAIRRKFDREKDGDMVTSVWKCWDTDFYTTLPKWDANEKVRRCRKYNAVVFREDFLGLGLDSVRLIDGGGVLVCESTEKWKLGTFVDGINPAYKIKCQAHLYVTGEPFCDWMVYDGFDITKRVELPDLEIFAQIEQAVADWLHYMQQAIPLSIERTERKQRGENTDDVDAQLDQLQPEPEATQKYVEFLKDYYKPVKEKKITANLESPDTLELLTYAYKAKEWGQQMGEIRERRNEPLAHLRNMLKDLEEIDMGEFGKITNKVRGGESEVPVMWNSINREKVRQYLIDNGVIL